MRNKSRLVAHADAQRDPARGQAARMYRAPTAPSTPHTMALALSLFSSENPNRKLQQIDQSAAPVAVPSNKDAPLLWTVEQEEAMKSAAFKHQTKPEQSA